MADTCARCGGDTEHDEAPSSLWLNVSVALFSIVTTLIVSQSLMGRDTMSRSQIQEYVANNSPYVKEKGALDSALIALAENQKLMQNDLRAVSKDMDGLRVTVAQSVVRLDSIDRSLASCKRISLGTMPPQPEQSESRFQTFYNDVKSIVVGDSLARREWPSAESIPPEKPAPPPSPKPVPKRPGIDGKKQSR